MATDDILLRVGMGRLEIEPMKLKRNVKEENPFSNNLQKRIFPVKTFALNSKCSCLTPKKKNSPICKKKHNKLLRDPVLKLSRKSNIKSDGQHSFSKDILPHSSQKLPDNLCLHTLVNNCNQLSISSKKSQSCLRVNKSNNCTKWWKCDTSSEKQLKESTSEKSSSCSQQALNPPCDITIDELASYFETLVHIPKKMSSMAEMMYI